MTTLTLPAARWRIPPSVLRLLAGGAILVAVAWHVGTGPALTALRGLDARSMGAAAAIAVLTTACCAWRWALVARAVGLELRWRTALAAYYRSQFFNLTLPGGILGDLHRGVHHGRVTGDVGRALRAVLLERTAGQAVQLAVTVAAVALLPSPVRPPATVAAALLLLVALVLGTSVVLARRRPPAGRGRWARTVRAVSGALREAVLARQVWPAVALASAVVVAGHVLTFVIAARVAGSTASTAQLVPLALFVLLAMGVPVSIAGWGPREGAAAWTFAAAGLTAAQGLGTAIAYGVLVLVASLPGGAVALVGWVRERHG